MAWNEPGGDGRDRDPWGGRPRGGGQDIDEAVQRMQERLRGMFGGGRGDGNGVLWAVAGLVLLLWLLSGIYIVAPAERGIVMRFGSYQETTQPGPHWHLPFPIEAVEKVDVDRIRSLAHQASVLTQDENIVIVNLAVQYRVAKPEDFLFNVRHAEGSVKDATETSLREVIGRSTMDYVITEGRDQLVVTLRPLMQDLLNNYRAGIEVTSVNLKSADPPEEVKGAFNDATKAREDEVRQRNEAEAYANEVVPKARGAAARQLEEANAYRSKLIAEAQGEAARFSQLRAEYERAPAVTRERLYLETMEAVLGNNTKVVVDTQGGNNVLYLPLDKMGPLAAPREPGEALRPAPRPEPVPEIDNRTRSSRTRGGR